MTLARSLLALLLICMITAPCRAQAATQPAGLDKLAAELASDDFKTREAAQKQIIELGEDAVPAMKKLAETASDPELQGRAGEILRRIEAESLVKPTRVTLKFKNAAAGDVYASLFKQAGAALVTQPPDLFARAAAGAGGRPVPPVTIDADKVPFWEAFQKIQSQTGLSLDDFGGQMCLRDDGRRAQRRGRGPDLVSIDGVFMVVADDMGGGGFHRLKVYVEPRITLLAHAREATIDKVLDAQGRAIRQPGGGFREAVAAARLAGAGPGADAAREHMEFDMHPRGNVFDVDLSGPVLTGPGGHVSGSIRARLRTGETTIEFDDVAKANNLRKEVDGRRFMLNAMNVDPREWSITLVAYKNARPTPGLENAKLIVVNADGVPLPSGGSGLRSGGNRVEWTVECNEVGNGGPPSKLKLVIPTESKEVAIPFKFGPEPPAAGAAPPAPAGR